MIKIAHLTSVHNRYDTRIFLKMCSSLAKNGYKVTLIAADGLGDEKINGIDIIDVGAKKGGRISRLVKTVDLVYNKAIELDIDIYHLHDPELILIAKKLQKNKCKVIFDSHEDLPKQLLNKPYLNKYLKWLLSKAATSFEATKCKSLDGIITATPSIRDKFSTINHNTLDINNYPLLGELAPTSNDWNNKRNEVCYVGRFSVIRGIKEIVEAMGLVKNKTRLQFAGGFSTKRVESEAKSNIGWKSIDEFGFLDRKNIAKTLNRSIAGIVTFHPLPNHIDAQPNKMFEYMSAGIPVIASDFPLWRKIIEGNNCGLCVDPLDPRTIADAIDHLVTHPEQAKQMGKRGFQAIQEQYNWEIEEVKLLSFYEKLIKVEHK